MSTVPKAPPVPHRLEVQLAADFEFVDHRGDRHRATSVVHRAEVYDGMFVRTTTAFADDYSNGDVAHRDDVPHPGHWFDQLAGDMAAHALVAVGS